MTVAAIGAANAIAIWNALIAAGANPVQAAGIMANMWFESNFDPEAGGIDSNGKLSVGLIEWNNNPTAQGLRTGNVAQDIKSQVSYLIQTGGLQATGNAVDPASAAANFAHNYEKCAACGYQGGSGQLTSRASIAPAIYAAGTTGQWGAQAAQLASANGVATGGQSASQAATTQTTDSNNPCFLALPSTPNSLGPIPLPSIGGGCIIKESYARAFLGGFLIASGGLIILLGITTLILAKEVPKLLGPVAKAASPVGRGITALKGVAS